MYIKPYIEIAKSLKSILPLSPKKSISSANKLTQFEFEDTLLVTESMWSRYKKLVNWKQDFVSPIFPYSLLIHMHIKIVSHKLFPVSMFGILHKREIINQFKPIRIGKWQFKSRLKYFNEVHNGYEISLVTELYIDNEFVWQSETIGIVKDKSKKNELRPKTVHPKLDTNAFQKETSFKATPFMANQYAWFSGNIDPIHFSVLTSKLMGHPSSIMHGMWAVGRAISEVDLHSFVATEIQVKFISSLFLPCEAVVLIQKNKDNIQFCLNSKDNPKPYLLGKVTFKV